MAQAGHRGVPLDLGPIQARSEGAWCSSTPSFSIFAGESARNHLGFVFGGNIFDWALRAAVNKERTATDPKNESGVVMVQKGRVEFFAPIHVGDEVRLFAERRQSGQDATGSADSHREVINVSIVARRDGGFPDAPLQYMQVAHAEVTLVAERMATALDGDLSRNGYRIGAALENPRARCTPNPMGYCSLQEGLLREYAQLASVADIQWYLQGCRGLLMSEAPHTVVTRDLTLSFPVRAAETLASLEPVSLVMGHTTRKRVSERRTMLRVEGVLASGGETVLTGHATMIALGTGSIPSQGC